MISPLGLFNPVTTGQCKQQRETILSAKIMSIFFLLPDEDVCALYLIEEGRLMKIVSWNVNGIRSIIGKGFYNFVEETDPDIVCLQEIKANEDQVELSLDNYPYRIWNSAEKKGYSGTAIFSKISGRV